MAEGERERVLVVRVGALGDTLMATPLIRPLCDSDFEVDFLCSELAAPLVESNPGISACYSLRWKNLPYVLSSEKRKLVRSLRNQEYRSAFVLEAASRFRELAERAGIRTVRSFRDVPFDPALHAITNNLRFAGFPEQGNPPPDMQLYLAENDMLQAEKWMESLPSPCVGIHPGYGPLSRKKNQTARLKGWGIDNFSEVGEWLLKRGAGVLVTGAPEDQKDALEVCRNWPVGRFSVSAGRTSVGQLAALISRLDLFISVDSGPAHMAAALGTPLIVLWGPALLKQTRPVSSRSPVRILRHKIECAPCYGTSLMKTCRDNLCMQGISTGDVFEAVRQMLPGLGS